MTTHTLTQIIEDLERARDYLDGRISPEDQERALGSAVVLMHTAHEWLREDLAETARKAHHAGVTWSEMARELGVSPQAVQQRWGQR